MSLKLDMAKVYDRMEWDYLKVVMEAFGFHSGFTQIIYPCVHLLNFYLHSP